MLNAFCFFRSTEPCVEFLKKQAKSLGLPTEILYPVDKENPVLLMTLKGTRPDLPALMLNAHMDVVPVFPGWCILFIFLK